MIQLHRERKKTNPKEKQGGNVPAAVKATGVNSVLNAENPSLKHGIVLPAEKRTTGVSSVQTAENQSPKHGTVLPAEKRATREGSAQTAVRALTKRRKEKLRGIAPAGTKTLGANSVTIAERRGMNDV